ncbi:MAG: hypothetical protein HYS25_12700 [Ignavibacteriales bacterium]|nr:hypothetical protein [Ignavibacteriales bacterium]
MRKIDYLKMKIPSMKIVILFIAFNLTINAQSKITGIVSVGITISDMKIALTFYTKLTGPKLILKI